MLQDIDPATVFIPALSPSSLGERPDETTKASTRENGAKPLHERIHALLSAADRKDERAIGENGRDFNRNHTPLPGVSEQREILGDKAMQKVDHDGKPTTQPQIRVTPTEARGATINGRLIWVLIVGTALAVILLGWLGVLSGG
jgi:hypothetical protein